MVKVFDKTNNQEFYMDGILKENLDIIKPYVLKDWDMLFIFSGIEGGGKSTLAMQVARYLSGDRFTIDHICFSPQEFMEKIRKPNFLKPGDSIILDESFMINSRATMSELNRQFLAILSECRQKQLFMLLCCPNYFDLDKNLALWRSRGMFYIYHDKMQRGYFRYYSYERKKMLYVMGKKFFNYNASKHDLVGRFTKYVPLEHEKYKALKLKAFEYRPQESKGNSRYLDQRNILLTKLNDEGHSLQSIAEHLTKQGHKITKQALSTAINKSKVQCQAHNNNLNENEVGGV